MITDIPIHEPIIERKAYIFFYDMWRDNVNKLIGEFIEQSNDNGDIQYLFKIYYNVLDSTDLKHIVIPGIDVEQMKDVYVRSGGSPVFITQSVVPKGRGDVNATLNHLQMKHYDPFEMMLRSRAITRYTNCYLGRTTTDFVDVKEYKKYSDYFYSKYPNLPCGNFENDYHPINA